MGKSLATNERVRVGFPMENLFSCFLFLNTVQEESLMAVANVFPWFAHSTSHSLVFLRGISLSHSFVYYYHIHTGLEPREAYGDSDRF